MGYFQHNLVVLVNGRSVTSFLAIVAIVWGEWRWNRKWDSHVYQGKSDGSDTYKPMTDEAANETTIKAEDGGETAGEQGDAACNPISEMVENLTPEDTVGSINPISELALVGWVLLAFSFMMRRDLPFQIDTHLSNLPSVLLILFLGFIRCVLMPKAMVARSFTKKQEMFFFLTTGGFFFESLLTIFLDMDAPIYAAPIGALCVAVAPFIAYRDRIAGEAYDRECKPNLQPNLFNFGGPVLVFGWFWFWIGMNVIFRAAPRYSYFSFSVGPRMFVSFMGAILIVMVVWMTGHALDMIPVDDQEGATDTPEILQQSSGFAIGDRSFGYMYEIEYAYAIAWGIFGVASFFPFDVRVESVIFFLAAVAMGSSLARIEEKGMRLRDKEIVDSWARRSYVFAILLIGTLPIGKALCTIPLAVVGGLLVGHGLYLVHLDRRRGRMWLESNSVQFPVVYSSGAIIFPLGMVLCAWANSQLPQ